MLSTEGWIVAAIVGICLGVLLPTPKVFQRRRHEPPSNPKHEVSEKTSEMIKLLSDPKTAEVVPIRFRQRAIEMVQEANTLVQLGWPTPAVGAKQLIDEVFTEGPPHPATRQILEILVKDIATISPEAIVEIDDYVMGIPAWP